MKPKSFRAQLGFVALGYAAVLMIAAALLLARYLQERMNPADAAGGMWAFGDLLLGIFIVCLFMIPTFFLVWVMAKVEAVYTTYSQLLLGIALSAPVCLGLSVLGKNHISENLASFCFCRLALSPFILVVMGVSRWMARFGLAKKLTFYALLAEGLTLGIGIVRLFRG